MNAKHTGLKSIAYELNISINTVSRALRDCDDISDTTKERVRQKAYELGYLPNNVSQFIKRDGRQLVAIVVNSLKNGYFSIVCEKLVNLISQENFDFTIIYSKEKKLSLDIIKQCISQRVDGIITLLEPQNDAIDTAKLNNMPIVLVGRNVNKEYVDELYTDDELGGQLVANYLANYHKLKKFIYVKIPNVECCSRRQKSFQKHLAKLCPDGDFVVLEAKQMHSKLISLIHQEYYGVFCFNDELAYEALSILNNEIPHVRKVYPRLHIIGYDCISTRMTGMIDLTSIDFDYDEMCQQAFLILKERLQNTKVEKKSLMFTVKLHQRKYF